MQDKEEVFTGEVIWFGKGYGFIKWSKNNQEQKDLFVHWSDISAEPNTYRTLVAGSKVSFQIGKNHNGDPKAIDVKLISKK